MVFVGAIMTDRSDFNLAIIDGRRRLGDNATKHSLTGNYYKTVMSLSVYFDAEHAA